MATNFSANQYENAFRSQKLQNWTIPKQFKERPTFADGHTTFIATDRGHLLPGVKRATHASTFVGTWDLPRKISPTYINPTARSLDGQERLRCWSMNQGHSKRRSFKCREEAPKSPENAVNDTLPDQPESQEIPEVLPQLEAAPTSPRPVSQPRSASANQQEENQEPQASDNLCPDAE
ncbi:protein Flattop [Conger conger]|uniref:protein Flattop n=1 Tax=Conger conger TaxID=82655 RepID=UPI002A59A111|nr:protein Flattop [Conger conger]